MKSFFAVVCLLFLSREKKQLAELFATSVPNINIHISNILKENELNKNAVVKDYLITASDGKKYKDRKSVV